MWSIVPNNCGDMTDYSIMIVFCDVNILGQYILSPQLIDVLLMNQWIANGIINIGQYIMLLSMD